MLAQLKTSSLLFAAILFSGGLFAQTGSDTVATVKPFAPAKDYRTWSIGINGGALSNYTIFRDVEDWSNQSNDLGFGGYVKAQILLSFGIQGNFLIGKLHGSGNNVAGSPITKYQTDITYAGDLSGVITLANINWQKEQGSIQPFISVGAGIMTYKPAVYNASNVKTSLASTSELYIPLGAGVKFNISKELNIDLGYKVGFLNGDNLDGNIAGASFDKFSYAHFGLEFILGKSSKPAMATHNPVAAMRAEYTAKELALQAQIDAEKSKTEALTTQVNTLSSSLTTTTNNLSKFTIDSDGDGVPNFFDKCPNTPAGTKVDGAGCPLPVAVSKTVYITEEDKKVVKDAISNLEFDLGKATIREVSFESLNKVAELLVSKNFSLKLAGHTDDVGSDALNLKLSKERAESIKSYLVAKGANPSRIEAIGYGETQPIASNKTPQGRQQNRRVEFTLY